VKAERLAELARSRRSLLCVGLDPAPDALPAHHRWQITWLKGYLSEVIQAALPYAIGFKFNSAFYEQWGAEGWKLLKALRTQIPEDYLVLLDGKRGDIAHTNQAYARAFYEELGFTGITAHPYLGWESLRPFYEVVGRWVFVLLRTTEAPKWQKMLWKTIISEKPRGTSAVIGWVWGAHHAEELRELRKVEQESWLLIPGLGAQGADLPVDLPVYPALIAVSRGILRDPTTLPHWQQKTALYLPSSPKKPA